MLGFHLNQVSKIHRPTILRSLSHPFIKLLMGNNHSSVFNLTMLVTARPTPIFLVPSAFELRYGLLQFAYE